MKKIYGGSISAHSKHGSIAHVPITLTASNMQEAIGIAVAHAEKIRLPTSEGYFSHSAILVEVTDQQIKIVTEQPAGDGK